MIVASQDTGSYEKGGKQMSFTYEQYLEAKRIGAPHAGRPVSAKTIQDYRSAMRLAEEIVGKPVAEFTWNDAITLLTESDKRGYSDAMRNVFIQSLRGLFNWAINNGLYQGKNPFESIRISTPRRSLPRILSQGEIQRLINAVDDVVAENPEKYKLIFSLMAYSGLRVSEVLGLKKENVLNDGIKINGKGNKEAFVPVRPDILRKLRDYIEEHPETDYVFYSEYHADDNHPLWYGGVNRVFSKAREIAGLPEDVRPHTLRHSFATHALRKTRRLEVVQDLLRHNDPKTTRFYAQLTKDDLMDEYAKLWR